VADNELPVVEMFGPTIQGEGPDAGKPCHFIRLGGCDFRCAWCDSMHAVDPAQVREAPRLNPRQIAKYVRDELHARAPAVSRIVVSGGNPALHDLTELLRLLGALGYSVACETQGSVFKPWMMRLDLLVVSPKPPSAGAHENHPRSHDAFMQHIERARLKAVLKVVCFDDRDLEWAAAYRERYPWWPLYLSVGTPLGLPSEETRRVVADRYAWLAEAALATRGLGDFTVLPQLHVVAWGTKRGV
jgi:7-carboxy-7-deazaguanine synthase